MRELADILRARHGDDAVAFNSINRFELGTVDARGETLRQLHAVYEAEGLRFTNGGHPGVSWDSGAPARWAAADAAPAKSKAKSRGTGKRKR